MTSSVLVVDDLPEFSLAFGEMISATPDMVLAGSSDTLAGGLALLDQGPVDILLVDLGLPDGSGLTLIREAVKRWPGRCDVMVISVFADEHHVLAAIEAGATGYLLKKDNRGQTTILNGVKIHQSPNTIFSINGRFLS